MYRLSHRTPTPDGGDVTEGSKATWMVMWWPLAVFLLMRPYEGIVHDARLYVGFALAPLDPNGIGLDILFQQDGQSGYSVYPAVLRRLVQLLGPSSAAFATTYAALVLWFYAAWRFVERFVSRPLGASSVALIMVVATSIHTFYGGSTTFHFAEPFASPRPFAEASVLLGLSFALTGALVPCLLWLAGALAIHPLMAIGGVAAATLILLPSDRARWYLGSAGVLVGCLLLLLTFTGLTFGALTEQFDADWRRVLQDYGSLVFLQGWEPLDFARIVVHLSTFVMAYQLIGTAGQRLLVSLVIIAIGAIALTFFGADRLQMVLIAKAQPWRVLWVVAFVSAVLLGVILHSFREPPTSVSEGTIRRFAAVALLVAWCMVGTSTAAAILSVLAAFLWWLPAIRPGLTIASGFARAVPVIALAVLLAMALAEASVVLPIYASSPGQEMLWYWPTWILSGVPRLVIVCAVVPALAGLWAGRIRRNERLVMAVMLATALAFTLDSRSRYQESVERALDKRVHAAGSLISGPVLWPDGELEPWAFLGSAGYGSIIQGTPRVFSRSLALQWGARRERLTALESEVRDPRYRLRMQRLQNSQVAMQELCTASDAPAAVAFTKRPEWAKEYTILELPMRQLLPPQDPGQPWEIRSSLTLVQCPHAKTSRSEDKSE